MADRQRDLERMIYLRREAEQIVRELFHPEGTPGGVRLVADVRAEADRFVLEVELPGVAPEELEVHALASAVVVEGRKRTAPPAGTRPVFERAERDHGAFRRVFDLPGPGDLAHATARLGAGLLTIEVPRITDRRGRPRAIAVRSEAEEEG